MQFLMPKQGFPNSGKGWGGGITEGRIFLLGEEYLRSDFDNSDIFQS